jgi:hypothetical protein
LNYFASTLILFNQTIIPFDFTFKTKAVLKHSMVAGRGEIKILIVILTMIEAK